MRSRESLFTRKFWPKRLDMARPSAARRACRAWANRSREGTLRGVRGSVFGIGASIYQGREGGYGGARGDAGGRGRQGQGGTEAAAFMMPMRRSYREIRRRAWRGRREGQEGAEEARAHAPPHGRGDDGPRRHGREYSGELKVAEAEGQERRDGRLGREGGRGRFAEEGRQDSA